MALHFVISPHYDCLLIFFSFILLYNAVSGQGGGGRRDVDRGGGRGGSRGGGGRGGNVQDVPSLDLGGGGGFNDPGQPSRVRFKER